MPGQISINLLNTIESISIVDACHAPAGADSKIDRCTNDFPNQAREKELSCACKALNAAAAKIHELYEKVVAQRREEIAKLSIEIARKILKQKIETKDYEIESIITEALRNSPSSQDVIVHLNPEDFRQCQKIREKEENGIAGNVRFVADPNVGRAECILKSPKGNILSLIDEQLEQIGEALKKIQ
ncbi:MAG: hypothetical protein JW787_08860 [Sedimentisphaerales bacterium]|nr:hypothetical protein [Sedimentisphaerales bacterium]